MSQLKLYIGAKIVRACKEERGGVCGYSMLYPDGYRSWSPRATFENAYREVTQGEKDLACVVEVRVNDPAALSARAEDPESAQ